MRNALGLFHQLIGTEVATVIEFWQEFFGTEGVDEGGKEREVVILLLPGGR